MNTLHHLFPPTSYFHLCFVFYYFSSPIFSQYYFFSKMWFLSLTPLTLLPYVKNVHFLKVYIFNLLSLDSITIQSLDTDTNLLLDIISALIFLVTFKQILLLYYQ